MFKFFQYLVLFCLIATAAPGQASESTAIDTGKAVAQLVTSHDSAAPGQTIKAALRLRLDEHWHTYWKNPGDSGEPVAIFWQDGPYSAGEMSWPLPMTLATGPIINYGFEGIPIFPADLTISPDAVPGETITLVAEAAYLVCYDVCIPESANLSLTINIGEPVPDSRWARNIDKAIAAQPLDNGLSGTAAISGDQLQLLIKGGGEAPGDNLYFFPEGKSLIEHSEPQNVRRIGDDLLIESKKGFSLKENVSQDIRGVLRSELGGQASGEWVRFTPGAPVASADPQQGDSSVTVWTALIGAFLGGLILNLMPCVFPVLSMKAMGFVRHAHDGPRIRRDGWLYVAGVFASFALLTAILLALKAAGSTAGWGFQLQNPIIIAALALLFFMIGLNLLGTYEIGGGLQNIGSAAPKTGGAGAFFTGVLAVIVATPCTAPFMAGAVGFALVQPAIVTFAVFMALAAGFALPFLVLSHWPKLLGRLPKPGPWMDRFKQIMAFPMFGATVWLLWVLGFQTDQFGTALATGACLTAAFGVYLWQWRAGAAKAIGVIALIGSLALIAAIKPIGPATPAVKYQAWSPETVQTLRGQGKAVFVDFTAAWCVTCKVNEKAVLSSADDLFAAHNTEFLVADWTNKNDEIAAELARHGRAGVPLYLLYPPGHNDVKPAILPQLLTRAVLENALAKTKTP